MQAAKSHGLLNTLDPKHLEKLFGLAKEVRFDSGEIVVREGEKSEFLHFILEGTAALEILVKGQWQLVQTLKPGDAAGCSAVLDGETTRDFQIRCQESLRTFAFE